jgi:TonB family protein
LRKELSAIHEYTADQIIINKQIDVEQYFNVLMENVINNKLIISNNFNNSLTKNRFIMMKNFNTKERLLIRLIGMILILSSMTIVFQACENGNTNSGNTKERNLVGTESQKVLPKDALKSDQEKEVDVYPSYPGGDKERIAFIAKNTRYPESAIKDSIQGMVYVNFIISKDGSLKKIKVLRGVNPEIDAEALRVISIMPKWNPAEKDGEKVDFAFTVPFKFTL